MLVSKSGSSPKIGMVSRTIRSTSFANASASASVPSCVNAMRIVGGGPLLFLPSSTVNSRSVKLLKSVGLSIR